MGHHFLTQKLTRQNHLGFFPVDDHARIEEIRQALTDHNPNLYLHLSAAAAVGIVAAEGKWVATIEREKPKHIEFEAAGSTEREAAEQVYAKFIELVTTERTSRPEDVSEAETSKEPDT